MKRLLVFALAASLGNASAAFAGETLLASAARIAQEVAQAQAATADAAAHGAEVAVQSHATTWMRKAAPATLRAQGGQPSLEASGMRKRTKLAIGIGLAVAFAASAWTIDHRVEDSTPSSAGTRQDNGDKPPL